MAIVRKNILGTLHGSVTDVIYRVRNGKLVAYSRPAKQKISKSKAAISARNKFALTVALAKEINNNSTLSMIWKQSKIKATNAYQKLIKYNSLLTDSDSLTLKNAITPDGTPLKGTDVVFSNDEIELTIDCSKIDTNLLKSDKLFCLVCLSDPKTTASNTKVKPVFKLQLFEFALSNLSKTTTLSFLIDIKDLNKPKYNNGIIYFAMTGELSGKYFHSVTGAVKFI